MDMDVWHSRRRRAAAAVKALQLALARVGVPEKLWEPIKPMMARSGYPYIVLGTLTVTAAEEIARALEAVPQQHTVPDAGDDPDHARSGS